nr:hypothetical protein BaRGS_002716 [Batillaria attramentaria]
MSNSEEPYYITLSRLTEKYGPVITVYLGPVPCVTLNRVDVVMEALVKKGGDFSGRPYLYSMEVMTEGFKDIIFANDSTAWKLHRKIAVQALRHYMSGAHLEEVVQEVVTKAVEKMLAEPGAFNPHSLNMMLMFVMLDMFCFGGSKDFDEPKLVAQRDFFDKFTTDVGNGFLEDIFPPLRYFPTKKFRSFSDGLDEFLGYIYERIDEHRKHFSPSNIRDITDSILLAQKQAEQEEGSGAMQFFTNTHVGQTVLDLFAGGIDTSRMTLDWGIYYIASFPEVQKRMQAEIDTVTGDRLPGLADRPRLQYTEATLYEIMRMGTVVPMGLPHKTAVDTTIGGYEIPKDMMVLINHWALLHDPEKWDRPINDGMN